MSWLDTFEAHAEHTYEERMNRHLPAQVAAPQIDWGQLAAHMDAICAGLVAAFKPIHEAALAIRAIQGALPQEPDGAARRALPRPSTTPPMWAVDPTRQNRRTNR